MKTDTEKIEELQQLVRDLWEVRGYGIEENKLYFRVSAVLSNDFVGYRPCDENGISLVPDIKDGKISYTKYFENET